MEEELKRYENIDCLRTLSCFAIIAMHIRANTSYNLGGYVWNTFIPSWTWLVYLFFIISSFSMCCGYYEKIANGTIGIEEFYIKRIRKTVPFFYSLVFLAVVEDCTLEGLYEGLMEVTMAYGLLPNNNMSILGVCWTLGVIFLFYMLFPYFVFLIRNKRRAWLSLGVSLVINQMCSQYFFTTKFVVNTFTPRHSFLFCIPFFIWGGVLFLYRKQVELFVSKHRGPMFGVCIVATVAWYVMPEEIGYTQLFTIESLTFFGLWLAYAISVKSRLMNNRFMKYFGGISMEMYLAQMVVFRGIEKLGLLYKLGRGWIAYIAVNVIEITLLTIGIEVYKYIVKVPQKWVSKRN